MFNEEEKLQVYLINYQQEEYIRRYKIRKPSKGGAVKYRKIVAPIEEYKLVQERMLEALESVIHRESSVSYAWSKGINRHDCAAKHVGQKCVLELDISDYFNNITSSHLRNLFYEEAINDIGGINIEDVIRFCTIDNPELNRRQLAQGFKTSPFFANAVRIGIDGALNQHCLENDFIYTSYGDNLIISGDYIPYDIIAFVDEVLQSYGFNLNRKKIKFMGRGTRQTILGLTVNEKVAVDKPYTKKLTGEVIDVLKGGGVIDAVLMGKVNTLRGNTNLRDYNYLMKLVNLTKVRTSCSSG